MNAPKHWKISDFVEELRKNLDIPNIHINTVDGWFKRLENDRIHYINRTVETNEKIYDELDLKIAIFIKQKREEKWALGAISRELTNFTSLRPFPTKEEKPAPYVDNIEALKNKITEEVKKTFAELAATQMEELKNQYNQLLTTLPKQPSPEEQRTKRFEELMLQKKIERKLEEDAEKIWSELPETERLKKVGFFRKEVDLEKKNEFIRNYKNDHFESYLKTEMGLEI
ncbi:MerR family transcriptional regulator [Peribacillus huizhouensis]|uniref:MerR family transcriptional regulator n=1 Tax=Peribacillus huizhouensis TaxID=1501239 RepID=A0ABR6CWJ5_9BACI|nr:MerR family transcriptional regulator [Peribacillus huizhouensis]MBA9029334.1 hypothetical protein [Peribacillus huizhouensis]